MTYPVRQQGDTAIVSLTGDIDMHTSPDARKQILNCITDKHSVLVDLSAVTYIDSSGIASLVEGLQAAKTAGLTFALVGASAPTMNVLKLARLEQVFTLYPTLPDHAG